MTTKQLLGLFLLSSPFIGLFIFLLKTAGLGGALSVFGLSALIFGVILAGTYLITE